MLINDFDTQIQSDELARLHPMWDEEQEKEQEEKE